MMIDDIAKKMLDIGYDFNAFGEKRYWHIIGNKELFTTIQEDLNLKHSLDPWMKKKEIIIDKEFVFINGISITYNFLETSIPILYVSNYRKWDKALTENSKIGLDKIDDLDIITILDRIDLKRENNFIDQHLKDTFEFMGKEPVSNIKDEDIELKFIADNGEVKSNIWISKKEWDFNVAFRKYKMGYHLTENGAKWLEEHKEIKFEK